MGFVWQVKSDGGKQTIILKMRYDQTVGDVRKYIDDHRCVLCFTHVDVVLLCLWVQSVGRPLRVADCHP